MADYSAINRPGRAKNADGSITPEEYRRQEKKLEETCRQFEGIMFAKLWKDMLKSARNFGEAQEKKREYGPLEDTVVEMVSEHLSESQGGVGVWKVLYDQLHAQLPMPPEIKAENEAAAEAAKAKRTANVRPSKDKAE